MVDDFNDEDFQFLDEWNTEPIHPGLDVPIGLSTRFTDMSSAQIMFIVNSTLKMVNREDLMVSRRGVDNVKKRLLERQKRRNYSRFVAFFHYFCIDRKQNRKL